MANISIKRIVNVDLAGCEVEALKTVKAIIENLYSLVQEECCSDLVTTLRGLTFNETSLEDSLDIITAILEESEFEIEE